MYVCAQLLQISICTFSAVNIVRNLSIYTSHKNNRESKKLKR